MQVIESLGPLDSKIVHCVVEGYSYAETASMTGLTVAAVTMRMQRARKKIKSIIR